jgi:hypothetical protein
MKKNKKLKERLEKTKNGERKEKQAEQKSLNFSL